ncbi:MAG: aldo/keto reductase, partial [Chloroflexi bacterium]
EEFVRQGKARFIGFSSHTVPVALQAARSGKFDLLMFPINPAFDRLPGETGTDDLNKLWDQAYFVKPEDQPAGADEGGCPSDRRQVYLECASRGIGLVAMKPFAGGWLFRPDLDTGFRPVNLIHYALSQPGVSCVAPGAATLEQLAEDVRYLTASAEETDYSAALANSRWNSQGACMYCSHCQPCTAGIDIAEINRLLDQVSTANLDQVRQAYRQLEVLASECQACEECMDRCPFGVDVVTRMKRAVALFEGTAVSSFPGVNPQG